MARAALNDVLKLLSGNLAAKLFGVAALMLFARTLTREQLAIFPVYQMLIGLSSLFFSFGIFQTFVRKLPSLVRENQEEARSLVMTGAAIVLAGIVLVAASALLWSRAIAILVFHDQGLGWAIRMMVAGFLGAALAKIAENIMWGRGQFAATSILPIIDSVVRPLVTIALYFWLGLEGIVIGLVVAQIANAVCSLYCVRDIFLGALPKLYSPRRLIAESLPFYIDGYLWYLKGDGDTLLVTLLLGPSVLAEYYLAKTLYLNVMTILMSLDKVALERLARYASLPEVFRRKACDLQTNISRTMAPLTLLFVAATPYAMTVLGGARYGGAKWPAVGLLLVALVQFLVIPADRGVFIALSGFWRLGKTAVEAVVALAAALLLAPKFGLIGIVGARILGPAAGGVFAALLLRRKLALSLPFVAVVPVLAAALPGTLLVVLAAPPLHGAIAAFLGMMGGAAVWVVAFAALTYLTDRAEFEFVLSLLRVRYQGLRAKLSQKNSAAIFLGKKYSPQPEPSRSCHTPG